METTVITEICRDIWAVNELDKITMYLINGTESALLIDPGLGITDLKKVIREKCGDKPVTVVNTHAHLDHNSGNNQFQTVYVGRFDEPFSHTSVGERERRVIEEMYFDGAAEGDIDRKKWMPGTAPKVRTLRDGDKLDIGGYIFRVLEIPSHSIGSIALLEEEKSWLFTGDVLLTWEVWGHLGIGMLSPSVTLCEYRESLRKLKRYVDKTTIIFPSHGRRESPEGCSQFRLCPEIINIYLEGITKIIEGEWRGERYESRFHDGLVKTFKLGGIVYDEDRIG